MCSVYVVQLSHTPALPYAAVDPGDSAGHTPPCQLVSCWAGPGRVLAGEAERGLPSPLCFLLLAATCRGGPATESSSSRFQVPAFLRTLPELPSSCFPGVPAAAKLWLWAPRKGSPLACRLCRPQPPPPFVPAALGRTASRPCVSGVPFSVFALWVLQQLLVDPFFYVLSFEILHGVSGSLTGLCQKENSQQTESKGGRIRQKISSLNIVLLKAAHWRLSPSLIISILFS